MAQMEWRKYPDVMPDADGIYIAVVEYDTRNGVKGHSVSSLFFAHDLAEAGRWDGDFEGEHRPGWCVDDREMNVVYWMPFPKLPDELKRNVHDRETIKSDDKLEE